MTGEGYRHGGGAKSRARIRRRFRRRRVPTEPVRSASVRCALTLFLASLAAAGCAEPPPLPDRAAVLVHFSLEERPIPVSRVIPDSASELEAALRELVKGPTPVERRRGLASFFSPETADALRSVEVDSSGHVVVDFRDLRPVIPGASSSAGSADLLEQLNRTVFQFAEIHSVEYRMEGSCDRFWEWLQRSCRTVRRESTAVR